MQKLGDFHTASDQELISGVAAAIAEESTLAAARLAMLDEIDRRGLAMRIGYSSAARWYAKGAHITEGSAKFQVAHGHWLRSRPTVLSALANGEVRAEHTTAIEDGLGSVRAADPTLDDARAADVVADLLDVALNGTKPQVARRAQELAHAAAEDAQARYDKARRETEKERSKEQPGAGGKPADPVPDGTKKSNPPPFPLGPPPVPVDENTALNKLDIYPLTNGRSQLRGDLDKLTVEKLKAAMSPLAAPRPVSPTVPDPRTSSQRNADALGQILDRHLSGSKSRTQGGVHATVNMTVNLRDLLERSPSASDPQGHDGNGPASAAGGGIAKSETDSHSGSGESRSGGGGRSGGAGGNPSPGTDLRGRERPEHPPSSAAVDSDWPFHLEWTGPISRHLAEFLSCDANLTPVIVDDAGIPLALGRTFRVTTPELRAAVVTRDRCCVKCGRPASWCQVHHVVFWSNGGTTELGNLALVCAECHREIHNTDWQLLIGDDGHPYLIPPAATDTNRAPIPSYHRRRKPAA